MRKKQAPLPKPTAAELEILAVLWRTGASTVREVHAGLANSQAVRYTTTLKLMQIMAGKGLLIRDERDRAHVYRPAVKQEQTQRQIVHDLLDRVFGGSASQLVLRALSGRSATKQEVKEIRRMLDDIEHRSKS